MQGYTLADLMALNPDNTKLQKITARTVRQCDIWGDGQEYLLFDAILIYIGAKDSTTGRKDANRIQWDEGAYNVIRSAYRRILTAIKAAEGKLNDVQSYGLVHIEGRFYLAPGQEVA